MWLLMFDPCANRVNLFVCRLSGVFFLVNVDLAEGLWWPALPNDVDEVQSREFETRSVGLEGGRKLGSSFYPGGKGSVLLFRSGASQEGDEGIALLAGTSIVRHAALLWGCAAAFHPVTAWRPGLFLGRDTATEALGDKDG